MAVGKAKSKGGKKGAKKKIVDPFAKKDWYDVKAPNIFVNREIGKTLVNRTVGNKLASDGLKHRIYEVALADLQKDEAAFKKVRLICDDTQGRNCLTNFYGMRITNDKLQSMMKKWQTTIQAHVDAKTTDGYLLRLFCIGFTRRVANYQLAKCSYANGQKVGKIRKKMRELMIKGVISSDMKELVAKLIPDSIAKDIQKKTEGIYPLYNVHIRKVKVLKRPRFDLAKLMDLHTVIVEDKTAEVGEAVDRPDNYEPPVYDKI